MPSTRDLVRRIRSVKGTQQITKAMKMVAAAKLRKAQQAIQQMRPYANKLNAMLRNILSNLEGDAEKALGLIMQHKFHPWEGGEGKVTGQYLFSQIELAKKVKGEIPPYILFENLV